MTNELKKPVRVGLRISADTNEWLDKKSYEMGIPKTAIMNNAIESYKTQYTAVSSMPSMIKHLDNK
jgi:predicted DNA-binding protein